MPIGGKCNIAFFVWNLSNIEIERIKRKKNDGSTKFVNVKIYMFGVTALTGYVVGYMSSFPALLFFELVIATIGTIATCTWIGLGVLIQKFYLRHFRVINIILALILLECIWGMLR